MRCALNLPLAALTLPALLFSTAVLADYHVATTGSDTTGTGSQTTPWATIGRALQTVPDGSVILVHEGTYTGEVELRGTFSKGVTIRSSPTYMAKLRNGSEVITSYNSVSGIILDGFDIAHTGPGAGALVVHIDGSGDGSAHDIILQNNILHDSYNNDILKINNAATDIVVKGNIFYNQSGSDEHIDINSVEYVTVTGNVFFNDFEDSGRVNSNDTASFIVIKDSNGDSDIYLGSRYITVKQNIFLNWQGNSGTNFVLVGEDGNSYFEGRDITVENNLMLGNSANVMRAPFGVKGGENILFRNNTISGDLPSMAYAMRINREGDNPVNSNITFYNNIWADQSGTMGATSSTGSQDFSDTPLGETSSFTLKNNLYWNGGNTIPSDSAELINYTNDSNRIVANPGLRQPENISLPYWNADTRTFGDGSSSITAVFTALVEGYGVLPAASPALDRADDSQAPTTDILGRSRSDGAPDVGAWEYGSSGGGGGGISPTTTGQAVAPTVFLLLR